MAAAVLALMEKRVLDFSSLITGSSLDVVVAQRVEIWTWREVALKTRLHSNSIASGAGSIQIGWAPESWSEQEPDVAFIGVAGFTFLTAMDSTIVAPRTFVDSIPVLGSPACSDYVRLIARGTRSATGTIKAELSLEFDCKS